jgi:hypothetical protein
MACGPKEYRVHAEFFLRRARNVRNPILAEEFEKLAQSWLRLAEDAERGECIGSPVGMRTVQEYFD